VVADQFASRARGLNSSVKVSVHILWELQRSWCAKTKYQQTCWLRSSAISTDAVPQKMIATKSRDAVLKMIWWFNDDEWLFKNGFCRR